MQIRLLIASVAALAALAVLVGCCRPDSPFPPPPPMQKLPLFGGLTVTPDEGGGKAQLFTVRLDQAPNRPEPVFLGLLINDRDSGAEACYLFAHVPTGRPRLVHDSGSGAREATGKEVVPNRQCELHADGSAITRQGPVIEARFRVVFRPGFAGPKKLFVAAEDSSGTSTGIQMAGNFVVQ